MPDLTPAETTESHSAAGHLRHAVDTALTAQGVSRVELARRCGISPKHVSQVLNGHAGLSVALAEQMLHAVGWQLNIHAGPALTTLRVNLLPQAVQALDSAAAQLGDTRTQTVGRALELYAAVCAAANGQTLQFDLRPGHRRQLQVCDL